LALWNPVSPTGGLAPSPYGASIDRGIVERLRDWADNLAARALERDGRGHRLNRALDRAGIALRPEELVVVVVVLAATVGFFGLALVHSFLGALACALAVPIVTKVVLDQLT